jgi:hypothetical protein
MNSIASAPQVYLVLGAPGSGRREIVADLLESGFAAEEAARGIVLLAEGEATEPAVDARLGARLQRWAWRAPQPGPAALGALEATVPAGAPFVFLLLDGRANPVDQLEAAKPWILALGAQLARVITVVHCDLLSRHAALQSWHDACIHFSDVILLSRREGVANKWMSDLRARIADECHPGHLELVKGGRVKNPALVLNPQALRLSQYFDASEWDGIDTSGIEFGEDEEGEKTRTLDGAEAGEAFDLPTEDPWFVRKPGGQRMKPLPDIRQYL